MTTPMIAERRAPAADVGPRLRVLLLADSCHPDWVSLPAVAYRAAKAIADVADVVIATSVRNRAGIERDGCGRARVEYIDNERVAAPLHRLALWLRRGSQVGWTTNVALLYPAYLAFELLVWKRFRRELERGDFDVVHRLTPMSPTIPSPLASWSPVPFVLGPLNGGLAWPRAYFGELRREREHLTALRNFHRLLPYRRSTFERASAILAAFQHTIDDLPPSARSRALDFPEVGFDPLVFHPPLRVAPVPHTPVPHTSDRRTLLFAGRLVPYKCCDVVVAAFAASAALRRHRLVIVGDGPERAALERQAAELGVAESVEFRGWTDQAGVAAALRAAHVFAFPSIRELGAGVVVEALASGCVPVVVDYGGPGGLVDDTCGVRVALQPKGELTAAFGAALEALLADETRLAELSANGVQRALTEWSFEAKARRTVRIYEQVVAERRERDGLSSSRRAAAAVAP